MIWGSCSAAQLISFGLGELLRERNDLDAAEHLLVQGLELVRGTIAADAYYVTLGFVALARVYQARGAFDKTGHAR